MLPFYKKCSLLLLAVLLFGGTLSAQMSILIVDDTDDGFGHVSDFESVVGDLGYNFTSYDAEGTGIAPTAMMMDSFDLVIWHTGSDLDSLAFWNYADTSNLELESYLDNGGKLWLIGTDVLFDRHGGAPVSFFSGSFEFDYLGITSYDVQSYVDDSSTGLPMAIPAASSPIGGLPNLTWIFSTLWYADGVTPIQGGGESVYEMGDSSYILSGRTCGLWFDNGTSQALSFFFNVSQIVDSTTMSTMTDAVLGHFNSQITGIDAAPLSQGMVLYPNPASDELALRMENGQPFEGRLTIYSLLGEVVLQKEIAMDASGTRVSMIDLGLESGLYVVELSNGENRYVGKVIKL